MYGCVFHSVTKITQIEEHYIQSRMVKRCLNVFGSSSDSDTDVESSNLNNKRKKRLPLFDSDRKNDTGKAINDEEDYMKFSIQDDKEEVEDPRRFEGLKYEESQQARREEAMSKSLLTGKNAKHSKGLSIMEKMGFKIGESLGKSSNSESHTTNPIELNVKTNRLGIGAKLLDHANRKISESSINIDEYRNRIHESKTDSKQLHLVNKAMRICFELSGDSEIYYNNKEAFRLQSANYLWRPYVIELFENNDQRSKERVIRIDEDKIPQNRNPSTSCADCKEIDTEYEEYVSLEPSSKLEKLLKHIRDNYNYCLFCGHSFNDQDDLLANCPGAFEEDHLDQ